MNSRLVMALHVHLSNTMKAEVRSALNRLAQRYDGLDNIPENVLQRTATRLMVSTREIREARDELLQASQDRAFDLDSRFATISSFEPRRFAVESSPIFTRFSSSSRNERSSRRDRPSRWDQQPSQSTERSRSRSRTRKRDRTPSRSPSPIPQRNRRTDSSPPQRLTPPPLTKSPPAPSPLGPSIFGASGGPVFGGSLGGPIFGSGGVLTMPQTSGLGGFGGPSKPNPFASLPSGGFSFGPTPGGFSFGPTSSEEKKATAKLLADLEADEKGRGPVRTDEEVRAQARRSAHVEERETIGYRKRVAAQTVGRAGTNTAFDRPIPSSRRHNNECATAAAQTVMRQAGLLRPFNSSGLIESERDVHAALNRNEFRQIDFSQLQQLVEGESDFVAWVNGPSLDGAGQHAYAVIRNPRDSNTLLAWDPDSREGGQRTLRLNEEFFDSIFLAPKS